MKAEPEPPRQSPLTSRGSLSTQTLRPGGFPGLRGSLRFAELWQRLGRDLRDPTGGAFAAHAWREKVRAVAWECCRFLEEDRERARDLIHLSLSSEAVRASRDFALDAFAELIHEGRHERPEAAAVPREWAEGIAGAWWERLSATVRSDRFEALPEEVAPLLYLTVMPYLGADVAREELGHGGAGSAWFWSGRCRD